MARTLHIDFETCSEIDLKRSGAYVYANHPTTHVIVMAWHFSDEIVTQRWSHGRWLFPQEVINHVVAGGEVHAWNALFEYFVWNATLTRQVPGLPPLILEQVHCTMARAAYWGLPMALEKAAIAIGSTFLKDMVGHRMMLRMSKPRSYNADGTPVWWHETDMVKFVALNDYCVRDVDTEVDVGSRLPLLPKAEREIWLLDARMNIRGLRIDRELVETMKVLTDKAIARLDVDMHKLTFGQVPSTRSVAKLLNWVRANGVSTDKLRKADVAELIGTPGIPILVDEVLRVRQEAAKTSTAKLDAMLDAASADDRVRGLVVHYGASRTGRWAGRLVQVQNLPRPMKGVDLDWVIQHILDGADAETLGLVHGSVLELVSSCLRPCFIARDDHVFAICDYSAIEARVIAWLACQQDILDVFSSGQDVYVYTAKSIGSDNRQLGKVLVLACGFGMGATRFAETAAQYGITLDLVAADTLVQSWRVKNAAIVSFWYDLERAVLDVLTGSQLKCVVGPLRIRMAKADSKIAGALLIQLPSGRFLVYRNARIETTDGRRQICYDGVDQYTRKWTTIRTYGGKLAENVTQAVARCLLADAMLRIDAAGLPVVGTVHDEIISEVPVAIGDEALSQMQMVMRAPPVWATGLPLNGAGFVGERYGKS